MMHAGGGDDLGSGNGIGGSSSGLSKSLSSANQKWQYFMDKTKPHSVGRWVFIVLFLCLYVFRSVYLLEGWYIVTYGLGIYILNLFIGFLSPQVDPEDEFEDGELPSTLQQSSAEFRPFARKVPEFKFWEGCLKAVFISFILTFFEAFNLPVFWPILLMYFIILFVLTMKKQIAHMYKHKYLPWSTGKTTYNKSSK